MPESCDRALDFNSILTLVCPVSEAGRQLMRKSITTTSPGIDSIKQDYKRIKLLMQAFKTTNTKLLSNLLAHILLVNTNNLHQGVDLELHEIFELKQFIYYYQKVRSFYLVNHLSCQYPLPDLSPLFIFLDPDGHRIPTFHLSPLYSKDLKTAFDSISTSSLKLKHSVQHRLAEAQQALDIPGLKSEIVVSRMQQKLIDQLSNSGFYHISTQSVANIGFKLLDTEEQSILRSKISQLRTRISAIESVVLESINQRIRQDANALETAQNALASIDWDCARASFGVKFDCIIPSLSDAPKIYLRGARNLHLEQHLSSTVRTLQPIDLNLNTGVNVLIGPNMGGKTTALKTLGQFALMLRLAMPLPCKQARLPLYDYVWYNHDAQESSEDLSSFGRETIAFMKALKHKGRILFLLDEFAKGTNPAEGEALATATLKFLQKTEHTTLAATHYSAPAMLDNVGRYSIRGIDDKVFTTLKTEVKSELKKRLKLLSEAMDYSIIRLADKESPPMCALRIAEILGLDQSILEDSALLVKY